MKCTNCESQISSEDSFCSQCGFKLNKPQCSNCNALLSEDDIFCPQCGTKFAGEENIASAVTETTDKAIKRHKCFSCHTFTNEEVTTCPQCGANMPNFNFDEVKKILTIEDVLKPSDTLEFPRFNKSYSCCHYSSDLRVTNPDLAHAIITGFSLPTNESIYFFFDKLQQSTTKSSGIVFCGDKVYCSYKDKRAIYTWKEINSLGIKNEEPVEVKFLLKKSLSFPGFSIGDEFLFRTEYPEDIIKMFNINLSLLKYWELI